VSTIASEARLERLPVRLPALFYCKDVAPAFEYFESQKHFGKVCLAL
jgi:hypothetical protein